VALGGKKERGAALLFYIKTVFEYAFSEMRRWITGKISS
jgi:hypothetical protein